VTVEQRRKKRSERKGPERTGRKRGEVWEVCRLNGSHRRVRDKAERKDGGELACQRSIAARRGVAGR
jgi:hypothetical protein